MFRFSKKCSVEYLESSALNRQDFLVHAFCTRRGGVSEGRFASLNFSVLEGDKDDKIAQNGEIIASAFNLRVEQFFTVHQVHGDRILTVDHSNINVLDHRSHPCDAIMTDRRGLAIGIKTADCAPIFLADREKRIIGVVHAGWRGTALGIAAKVVTAFVDTFSSRPADMIAVIGPAIGPCCYEVDETVFKTDTGDEHWKAAFNPREEKGKWMLDLPSANRCQLIRAGVPPENVFSADVCTCCRKDLFFSHRGGGGKTGRQINFMMLKENKSV